MTQDPDASPSRRAWRFGTPAVFLVAGGLFVVAAQNSEGTDLRPSRYTDIASIVDVDTAEVNDLRARAAELDAEVEALSAGLGDRTVSRYNRQIDVLEDPSGFTPVSGPAVTITLTDAPEELIKSTQRDTNELVVHQQDIQAVVNAMWRGGAEAVTIQGQRVISTTGIKCSGNTVQLQGVPYSPPYVITGVGDQLQILNEIQSDSYLDLYRQAVADPEIQVGMQTQLEDFVTAPAYEGLVNLSYAVPMSDDD